MKSKFKILILSLLLLSGIGSLAQIGGNFSPLQYSIHTYSIVMDDIDYTAVWGIYPYGTTQTSLENNTAIALIEGTDYNDLHIIPAKNGNRAYFRVQFNGNIAYYNGSEAPGPEDHVGEYVLGFKETTDDGNACATAVIQPFTLYGPFDVDVAMNDPADVADCPDDDNVLHQPGDNVFQTEVVYLVNVEYPNAAVLGYIGGMSWSFNFEVKVDGESTGTNATIASIVAEGSTLPTNYTIPPGSSTFTDVCTVNPSDVNPVTFTIVFNDVLGVTQNVSFNITDIQGAYSEQDIDEVNSTQLNNNILANTIYGMPNVGQIEVWN
jgi:hypothetical protein